jgi:hypothetical protein
MPIYEFLPTPEAKKLFGLKKDLYSGEGMTPLLIEALGKKNYEKLGAQDPLSGGKTKGEIVMQDPPRFRHSGIGSPRIGTVRRRDSAPAPA